MGLNEKILTYLPFFVMPNLFFYGFLVRYWLPHNATLCAAAIFRSMIFFFTVDYNFKTDLSTDGETKTNIY